MAKSRKNDSKQREASSWALLSGVFGTGGLEWMKSFGIALLVALAIRWAFFEPFRIPSGSMEPTFMGDPHILKGDRVWVNKFVFGLRYPLNGIRIPFTSYRLDYAKDRIWRRAKPQRWDIVVFKSVEGNAVHTTLVKRVVGLPGERIHIANGKVYANGEPLTPAAGMPPVEYTSPRGYGTEMKYGILEEEAYSVVPEDSYLLLGDNSAQSRDGRYFGWVPYERILGRVACIWWPIGRWRDFTGFSGTWWWRTIVGVLGILLAWRVFFGRSWRYERGGKANHVCINRLAYGLPLPFTKARLVSWGRPERGDLVLYRPPAPQDGKEIPHLLFGRIAGVGGERVFLDAGRLEVNGAPVPGPLAERTYAAGEGVGPYGRSKGKEYSLVPDGHVFVLTEDDDPEGHLDSRTVGWIPQASLVGRAAGVWWPPHRWGR